MKNKIAIFLGICLLTVMINAQENKIKTNVIAEINESGVTFTIPDIVLDSADISAIQKDMDKKVKQIEARNKLTAILNQQISEKCPDISADQLKSLITNMVIYRKTTPNDITCTPKAVLLLDVSFQRDEGFEWYDWCVSAYNINDGKHLKTYRGQVNEEVTTFEELELQYKDSSGNNQTKTKQIFQ